MTLKTLLSFAFSALIFSNLASADDLEVQDELKVQTSLIELKIVNYGQPGCGEDSCPNISVSVQPASARWSTDTLVVQMSLLPDGCDVAFRNNARVTQLFEKSAAGTTTIRYFDQLPANTGSACIGLEPRDLTVSIRAGTQKTNTLRFKQKNNKFTEISYNSNFVNEKWTISNVQIVNDK
jgi:hypothetical protein